ncbi:FAD-binding oxidoreductase [Bacillus sp. FJAT-27251]|uniref:FAD-binding oxidoreductase n=1 Tax=Bacillus sp. FJAT-27251 TaxID=1684142 RepID=UPI0006A78BAC|nr:FAD-binding oxidoreductase [Bacillus sp. FJAT-27251]
MVTAELLADLKAIFPELKMAGEESVTIFPKEEEEIAKVLAYCNDSRTAVSVLGGGTKRGWGTPEKTQIQLSLSEYTGVVEHTPGDMTVTVKAGTTFKELQGFLAQYSQKLALDPSWPAFATVGGVIASNDSGPKRLGYGIARDSVIGLRTVYPDGRIIRSGGRVVKNVAGYDMNKLFIGSMGTLGVISEVTFKLRPLPKCESLALLSFPEGDLEEVRRFAINLLDSMMEPVALELLNPFMAGNLADRNGYTLAISFEDVETSVRYQEQYIKANQPSRTSLDILKDEEAKAFWNKLYTAAPCGLDSLEEDLSNRETAAAMKIGVVNLKVLDVIRECQLLSDGGQVAAEAHGGLGTGICQVVLRGSADQVAAGILQLRKFAVQEGGYAVVKHLPEVLGGKVDAWGDKPSYFPLMEGIKAKMDPNRILNPNAFIGGI